MIIASSLLAANWANLYNEARLALDAGSDWLHIDIMDHDFVPNMTFGPKIISDLRALGINQHIDAHLMVRRVEQMLKLCENKNINSISVHAENIHIDRILRQVRALNCKVGIAFNPATPLTVLPYVAQIIDYVLIMTVNPGFGGQEFITYTLDKIKEAKNIISKCNNKIKLQVDGGINIDNIGILKSLGVDIFIIGAALFNTKDKVNFIRKLRSISAS